MRRKSRFPGKGSIAHTGRPRRRQAGRRPPSAAWKREVKGAKKRESCVHLRRGELRKNIQQRRGGGEPEKGGKRRRSVDNPSLEEPTSSARGGDGVRAALTKIVCRLRKEGSLSQEGKRRRRGPPGAMFMFKGSTIKRARNGREGGTKLRLTSESPFVVSIEEGERLLRRKGGEDRSRQRDLLEEGLSARTPAEHHLRASIHRETR